MDSVLDTSNGRIGLQYLAEGAANVVYRILPLSGEAAGGGVFNGKLLRLRKDTPTSRPYEEIVYDFERVFVKFFPSDFLVPLALFRLPSPADPAIKPLNITLKAREHGKLRSKRRHGVYLAADENYGILVTDMTPKNDREVFIEFKPKWLIQSPSAPSEACRCRNCALHEMRRVTTSDYGRGDADFCPLDLLSEDRAMVEAVTRKVHVPSQAVEEFTAVFVNKVQPILKRLRDLQLEYDKVGLSDFERQSVQDAVGDDELESTSIGMTLRDCSVFVKVILGNSWEQADVRLADLDLKSNMARKRRKWAETEKSLQTGGWYSGSEAAESRGNQFCSALRPPP